jgi:hypothetical protein
MKKERSDTQVKMPTVDCDAVGRAMRLHEVDVEDLLARVWAVSGFAGSPTDHEARLLAKQKTVAGLRTRNGRMDCNRSGLSSVRRWMKCGRSRRT